MGQRQFFVPSGIRRKPSPLGEDFSSILLQWKELENNTHHLLPPCGGGIRCGVYLKESPVYEHGVQGLLEPLTP
jgi:hypothetical protein